MSTNETFTVGRDTALPWAKVDIQFVTSENCEVTVYDKAVYTVLAAHCGLSGRVNEEPLTRKVLARRASCGVRKLDEALYRLENTHKILWIERRKDPENPKVNLPSIYYLLDHERWDARAAERHARRQGVTRTGGGVVHDVHEGGAPHAQGVVHVVHHPGARESTPSSSQMFTEEKEVKASGAAADGPVGTAAPRDAEQSPDRPQTDHYAAAVCEPAPPTDAAASPAAAPRSDVDLVCSMLADAVEANGSRKPAITRRWRDAARLMIDRDGRTVEQILKAIEWCQNNDFWKANIMSMPKLREKYDQLRLQAQREQQQNAGRPSTTDRRVSDALTLAQRFAEEEAAAGTFAETPALPAAPQAHGGGTSGTADLVAYFQQLEEQEALA